MPNEEFKADCFGTVDKEKKEGCRTCSYSKECETFKPQLIKRSQKAAQASFNNYKKEHDEAVLATYQKQSKNWVFIVVVATLIIIFWLAMGKS